MEPIGNQMLSEGRKAPSVLPGLHHVGFLFLAAIVVPLSLIVVAGYANYRHAENEAFFRAQKAADALGEHAQRTLRGYEHLIDMVNRHVERMPPDLFLQSPLLSLLMRDLERDADDTRLLLADREGARVISGKGTIGEVSALEVHILNESAHLNAAGLAIQLVAEDSVSRERHLRLVKLRSNAGGIVEGVTAVSLGTRYFESIHAGLLETAHDFVALVRDDGVILAHTAMNNNVAALRADSKLMQAIRSEPEAGQFLGKARLMDNSERIFAYRRVDRYPLYVNYALSKTYVWTEWRSRMVPYVLVCLGATALLLVAAFFSRRRARAEQAASMLWAAESRMRQNAEDSNRAKDDFVAVLAHELRSPLASVSLSAEILKRLGAQNEMAASSLAIINRQAMQLRRLVDDMLDLARITHGKMKLECRPFDLLAVARRVDIDSLNNSGHPVSVEVAGEPVWVNADPARIEQVICNLVQNAIKYGGQNIEVRVTAEGDWARIDVRDDGQGIEPDLLPRLCEPFVQGAQAAHRPQGGLGLGLALVRELVLGHGGQLSADSDGPGKGSTFRIALPRIERPLNLEEPPARPVFDTARSRVLVVEDQSDARESLRLLLELHGQEVFDAADGEAALAAVEAFRPQIAFVDIGLPGMDGFEFARRLRQTKDGGHVALAALSGYVHESDERWRQAGFDLHLAKPVTADQLHETLHFLSRLCKERVQPASVTA